jgi:hypothetical protein
MPPLMLAIAIFWFVVGVAMVAVFMVDGAAGPPPAAVYVFFGAGTAFVGTVLTTVVPWGIRELWRHRKRGRVTVLPPSSQPGQAPRPER